jgi:hypothetical protein
MAKKGDDGLTDKQRTNVLKCTVLAFEWAPPRETAAQLLAEGEKSLPEIAADLGIHRNTLVTWKNHPEFAKRVADIRKLLGETIIARAIARKASRIRAMDERWHAMMQIIKERSLDPSMQDIPGGKTGMLVRTIKSVGSGDNCREVHEYTFDAALLKELREHERQAAEELGQWEQHVDGQRPSIGITLIRVVESPPRELPAPPAPVQAPVPVDAASAAASQPSLPPAPSAQSNSLRIPIGRPQ